MALLHEDATLTMPPFELWLQGVDDIGRFLAAMRSEGGGDRVVTLAANGCPALAVYRPNRESGQLEAFGIQVLECAGERIVAIHAFLDPGLFAVFGLPLVFAGLTRPPKFSCRYATTFSDSASCTGGCTPSTNANHRPAEEATVMTIAGKTVLITGANRGIGQALVDEALARGAKQVYAGSRQPITHPDERVTAVVLDVTDADQIRSVADQVHSLDVLVNNAGIALYDNLSDRAVLEQHLAVNLFGPYEVIQAFLPQLTQSRGAIVNNTSMMAMAPLPMTPAYAVSKAAAFNLTQSLRAILAGRGISVHAVLTGPTDTDMTRGFEIPKATPQSVARAIFDGVDAGEEDIFPDATSQVLAHSWRSSVAKDLEHQYAAFVQAA